MSTTEFQPPTGETWLIGGKKRSNDEAEEDRRAEEAIRRSYPRNRQGKRAAERVIAAYYVKKAESA